MNRSLNLQASIGEFLRVPFSSVYQVFFAEHCQVAYNGYQFLETHLRMSLWVALCFTLLKGREAIRIGIVSSEPQVTSFLFLQY